MTNSLFTVLAEPNRRWLLDQLAEGPTSVGDLVTDSGMSQPAVSKHLRTLKEAGLVQVEAVGQKRLYSINALPLREVDAWLHPYRKFWSERLEALQDHLKETDQGKEGQHE